MLDLEKIEQEHSDTCVDDSLNKNVIYLKIYSAFLAEIELCCADDPPRGAIYRSFDALQEVIDEVRLLRSMLDSERRHSHCSH